MLIATETQPATFEIIARNVPIQERTLLRPGFYVPRGEAPEMTGEHVSGDIARLSDGRLLGKSSNRFAWVDPATLKGMFIPAVDWQSRLAQVMDRWHDGIQKIDVSPPARDPRSAEFARFRDQWPKLWDEVSKALDLSIPVIPDKPLFKHGFVYRPKRNAMFDSSAELVRRHIFMGDFGEFGRLDPSPPTPEELWCFGSDALSVARSNSLAIAYGIYPVQSRYGDIIVTTAMCHDGPRTIIYTDRVGP